LVINQCTAEDYPLTGSQDYKILNTPVLAARIKIKASYYVI
jgi:hypothetical protein